MSPERFDRKRSYALGKMSGKASLKKNLDELDISLSPEDQAEVLKRIVSLGDSKHTITVRTSRSSSPTVLERKDFRHIEVLTCSHHQ